MYANHPDDVEEKPHELVENEGYECTEEAVDNCLDVLQKLGYGGKETPSEIMERRVSY